MNVKVSSSLDVKAKSKSYFPENSPWGLRKTYSPNQFYLTFRLDNFWNVDKIFNVYNKKIISTLLCKYIILLFFEWLKLVFFLNYEKPSYVNTEWCTVCTIIMIIRIINVKSFLKIHFRGDFSKQILKTNLWKKALLYTDVSEMTFVVGATKVNLKNLKT